MNPLTLRATNLRTFETLELDLPTGCTVIGGENGAGKSTILSAIDVALFAGRGELAPLLTLGEEELELDLIFEHAGEQYQVRRWYSAKGRGKATLHLERATAGVGRGDGFAPLDEVTAWEPLTRETADATQQHLEQLLGLSRATFRASSFLAQGDGAAFTEAQPRDRKAILAEILGLAVWDRLLELARRELRQIEDGLLEARTRISSLEAEAVGAGRLSDELDAARATLTTSEGKLTATRAALEEAQQALAANDVAFERASAAELAVDAAKAERERARHEYARAVQAGIDREAKQAELDRAAADAADVPALERELERAREWASLVEQRDQLRRQADDRGATADSLHAEAFGLTAKADHIEAHIDDAGNCEVCGQKLGGESAARAVASYRADAERLRSRATVHVQERAALLEQADTVAVDETRSIRPVGNIEHDLRNARAAGERRAALAEQVRQLAELGLQQDARALELAAANDKVKEADEAFTALAKVVAEEGELRDKVTHARRSVDVAESIVDACKNDVAKFTIMLGTAKRAEVVLAELRGSSAAQLRRLDLLKLAERAFGRDGIPALIVENAAIPQLEVESNRILSELGGATGDCRIELRTQRALKSSAELRETLDIVIVTPAGERAYETFSGGERTRLNLALRIALARLLAHRRGAESRLLAIDEPDGLDAAGMDALARILQGLAGDFDKVLVVSHQPQLATSFDQAIVVRKDGDRSTVVAGALEAAAA